MKKETEQTETENKEAQSVLYQNQLELQKQLEEQIALGQYQAEQLKLLQDAQKKRTLPASELDLNLMLTDTVWGNLSPALKEKLQKSYIVTNERGEKYTTKEDMSSLLGFYTRDLRLGNLSNFNGEIDYCEYHLDLANDFLKEGFIDPFLICLSRVATKLEISQSKGGFLRRRNSSFTTETMQGSMDPPKRNLMGSKVEPK